MPKRPEMTTRPALENLLSSSSTRQAESAGQQSEHTCWRDPELCSSQIQNAITMSSTRSVNAFSEAVSLLSGTTRGPCAQLQHAHRFMQYSTQLTQLMLAFAKSCSRLAASLNMWPIFTSPRLHQFAKTGSYHWPELCCWQRWIDTAHPTMLTATAERSGQCMTVLCTRQF